MNTATLVHHYAEYDTFSGKRLTQLICAVFFLARAISRDSQAAGYHFGKPDSTPKRHHVTAKMPNAGLPIALGSALGTLLKKNAVLCGQYALKEEQDDSSHINVFKVKVT